MKNHKFWNGLWHFVHKDKDGNIIKQWSEYNALADEGEQNILDTYFRNSNAPSSFYVRLYNDTPIETDTLSALTGEPSGNGYAAQQLQRNSTGFPTLELNSGDYRVVSAQVTFTASGGSIGPVTYAVLATTTDNTGKLIAYVALSTSHTLASGETLNITFTEIKLS